MNFLFLFGGGLFITLMVVLFIILLPLLALIIIFLPFQGSLLYFLIGRDKRIN